MDSTRGSIGVEDPLFHVVEMVPKPGTLKVTLLSANGLKNADTFGKQDPYVIVRVGQQTYKTKVQHNGGTNPVFNETFVFNMTSANDELKIILREYDMLSADDELGSARVLLHRLRERGGSSHIQAPVTLPKSTKQKGYVSLVLEFTPSRAAPAYQQDAYPQYAPPPHGQPQEQVAVGYPAGSAYPDMYAQYPPVGAFGGASGHSAPQAAAASSGFPYPGMHGGRPAPPHATDGHAYPSASSVGGAPGAHHAHSYSGPSTSSGTTHLGPPPSGYPGGGAPAGAPAMHGYGAPPPIAPVGAPLGANGQYGQPVPQYHPGKPNKPHRPMKPGLGMGLAGGLAAGLLGGLILDDMF